jgi:pyrroline-5-carboxylate reductase
MQKVTIIGYGAMAEAIGRGLKGSYQLEIVGRDPTRGEKLAEKVGGSFYPLEKFDIGGKIVILAVKPYALREVAEKLRGTAEILISILAGKKLEDLKVIPACHYLRAMPNIGAFYSASFTAIAGDRKAVEVGLQLFSQIGEVLELEGDNEIDIATSITGSGPAYLGLLQEAVEDAGVYLGLKREIASKLARGLFASFGKIEEKGGIIKEKVMSPNGTTAEGVFKLQKEGVPGKFMEAIIDGYHKAKRI